MIPTLILYSGLLMAWDKPTGMDANLIYSVRVEQRFNIEARESLVATKVYQPWEVEPWLNEYKYWGYITRNAE